MENEVYIFNIIVLRQNYYNSESSWGTYMFSTEDDIPELKTNTVGDKVCSLVGKMQELTVGGKYKVKATLGYHKTFGYQYNPIAVYATEPQDKDDQLLFLKSLIPERIAENLLEAYPTIINDVIDGTVDTIDYSLVKGVGRATWDKIKDKILNNYLISDIIVMLKPMGITFNMIKKLLSEEPNPSLLKKNIEENPWYITKISGISFKKADDFALTLKPELVDSVHRLAAFVQFYLKDIGENDGNTWCSTSILRNEASNNVSECVNKLDWLFENNNFLYISDDKIGLKYYHNVEIKIYDILKNRASIRNDSIVLSDEQIENAIRFAEEKQGFKYTDNQLYVIKKTLRRNVSIITGKAGSGKSSIMRAILTAYNQNNYTVTASALSAMASQRITEATGFDASTIHRTLGAKGLNKFEFNEDHKMLTNVMFLDEGSMVNATLFLSWLKAIGTNTRIIIAGDHKQLPPIGFGNIFSDIIDKLGDDIVSKLTKPMRQAEMSGILADANLIRENINPITEDKLGKIVHGELHDMYYMFRDNRESLNRIAIKTYFKSVESDGVDNVVIITPRKKGCINSSVEINNIIQKELLGNEHRKIESFTGDVFKFGARVMQTSNDYEKNVFNGEIGYITDIGIRLNEDGKDEEYCIVSFNNGKVIDYIKKELSVLELAYAMTVHKVQGSGIKTVIGIIDNTHYQLLDNCMLYTLLTRAKKRCLLLAEPYAFNQCIRTSHNDRNTWLSLL